MLFHLTAACFEHEHIIGRSVQRKDGFVRDLLAALDAATKRTFAWCVLTNHYHLLVETHNLRATTKLLGELHGRTSFAWNGAENRRGRNCFHRVADRAIRDDRHFWATMNYIHHNPVRHGSSRIGRSGRGAARTTSCPAVGRDDAARIWREYPLLDYGAKWDADIVSPEGGMNRDFPNEPTN